MAHNTAQPTGVERNFADDDFIISMTDTKGVLTYVNDIFLDISDYTEGEVVGQQHNILRHPDMPRCIFDFLWKTIPTGDELLAYVVNKTKHGDHYWVLAHVTASYDNNGNLIGYLSSRRTATRGALDVILPLYKQLKAEEDKHSSKKEGMQAGLNMLLGILKEKNISYSEFVLSL